MTEEEYTREAEQHLGALMERQRQQRVASGIMSAAFRDTEIDPGTISGSEAEPTYEDAKEAAREYAEARNSNARVRRYNEHNESAREGVQVALSWLQRKKKSAIKK